MPWLPKRLFVARNPIGILPPGGVRLDPLVLSATAAVVGGAAMLFGTLPALRALRGIDADLMRTRGVTPTRRHLRSRMLFVTAEIALSLVGSFAGLTLLLAVVGVYRVMTQFVELRRREIGIRVALGAGSATVVRLVLRTTGLLIAAGVLVGAIGAWASTRLLRGLVSDVSSIDPVALTAATVILAAVGIAASYLPARRAAAIDPAAMVRRQ